MKIPSYRASGDIIIYNLGDLHRGHQGFNYELWLKILDAIKSEPNAFWVTTGDLFEVALIGSKGDPYGSMAPESEFYALAKELAPIAHKCLGGVDSNHHARFEKASGMSMDRLFYGELGIREKFLGDFGLIRVICGEAPYHICMHHGNGGGATRGAAVNNLQKLSNIFSGADLYMEGHTHMFDNFVDEMFYIDKKRGNWVRYNAHFVTTGHMIDYMKSYAAKKKYKPSSMGVSRTVLSAAAVGRMDKKRIRTELFY